MNDAALCSRLADHLADLHHRRDGIGPDRIAVRTWTPHSERKQRQRLFCVSIVDGQQRLVAKIPLDPHDAMVEREWQVLSTARGLDIARPHAIGLLDRGFVMTYVPARDFPDVMAEAGPAGWSAMLRGALTLAATLHGAGPAKPVTPALEVAAVYLPEVGDLPPAVRDGLQQAAVGPTHGDFGPWNLRVDERGRISAIDWEDYQSIGLPALDVLNVVLTAALIAFPEYREHGFNWLYDRVFHEANPFRYAAGLALEEYGRLTATDPAAVMALTPLFCRWMIRRIESQGRPAAHLFFGPFAALYEAERPVWAAPHLSRAVGGRQ